jgi:hypothetical protein
MATPTKVSDVFFLFSGNPIVEVSANAVAKSTELNVASIFQARLFIDFAPTGVGAITVGPQLTIESTPFAAGDAGWRPIISPYVFDVATPNSSAVDGTEAAGQTLIEESTTTGLANDVRVFFKNSTLQNSEWSRVQAVSAGASFTIFDGLTNAQTGSTWFNLAQYFTPLVDLSGTKRIRAVMNNNRNATARACALRVGLVELSEVS